MDLEEEVIRLRGENIAVQSILVGLCTAVAELDAPHRTAVADAFDHADHVAERAAFQLGSESTALHLRTFAETVEELRKAVFG